MSQVYLDESKRGEYTVAVTAVAAAEVSLVRTALRQLLLPGARSLHFHQEQEPRKRRILAVISALPCETAVYRCALKRELDARKAILARIVHDHADLPTSGMVLDRDDSLVRHDLQALTEARAKASITRDFRFVHLDRHEEPLLWIPDAIAWAWNRGGPWRKRADPVVTDEIVV